MLSSSASWVNLSRPLARRLLYLIGLGKSVSRACLPTCLRLSACDAQAGAARKQEARRRQGFGTIKRVEAGRKMENVYGRAG